MSLENSTEQSSELTQTVKASSTISIQLTDASFSVISESISKNNHFSTELQKAQKEMQNNLIIAIEGSGHKAQDFEGVNLDAEKKTLILTKK
jgi:hypothetical protein